MGEFFSLLQNNEEYSSASNWEHFVCQFSVRGNKAEPGVNTLHVHSASGTVSDKLGSLVCNGDNRWYVCAVGSIGCSHIDSIKVHNMKHSGEVPHLSQLCGKGFVTGSELKKLGLSHTGEKPHMCMTCDK